MYYAAVAQCTQAPTWLDQAEQHAVAKKFDVGVLMKDRLAPDMQPFIYQVQSASITSRRPPPGSPGRRRLSTKTTSRRSSRCAPASERPSPSRRA